MRTHEHLVGINGMDATGKDTILNFVVNQLDPNRYVVIDPDPNKQQFPYQAELRAKIDIHETSLKYAIGYWLALPIIDRELATGKVVIVKKPFNFLMHSIRFGVPEVPYLQHLIETGRGTNGLWPSTWIEITSPQTDIVKNLKSREAQGKNTSSDPQPNLISVGEFFLANFLMLNFVRNVPVEGSFRYYEVDNPRIRNRKKREEALQRLAAQIVSYLPANAV